MDPELLIFWLSSFGIAFGIDFTLTEIAIQVERGKSYF